MKKERKNFEQLRLPIIKWFYDLISPKKSIEPKHEIIHAPSGAKYLSDFMDELPPNTFINKATTGVGATTMALESKSKYIIAVPFKSLALNKESYCNSKGIDVLVVMQGVSDEDIQNFKGSKVLVVFDSLWRVSENLKNKESFRLMVDEAHVILTSANFRGKGMNSILNHFKDFKDYVLITATPTPELYQIDGFKDIKRIDIDWPNKEKIQFVRDVITKDDKYSIEDKLILIARQHLLGDIDSNAYFFINSVKMITKVTKALIKSKLVTHDQVNLIVSEGNISRIKVDLGKSYNIGRPPASNETPKKLNFITSTAFEGSDFFDDNGKIYIISDGSHAYTKIDILTQLHQIAGRIRNSDLNKSIQIITKPSMLLDIKNIDDYSRELDVEFKNKEVYLDAQMNIVSSSTNENLNDRVQEKLIKEAEFDPFYIVEDGFVKMNKLYVASQIHHWKVLHQSYVYKLNDNGETIVEEGENCGVDFIDKKVELPPNALGKAWLGKNYSFKELAIEYIKARTDQNKQIFTKEMLLNETIEITMVDHIGNVEPLLHEAHRILGANGMARLNYNRKLIKEAIDKKSPINNTAKYLKIKSGWYSNRELKARLQGFYSKTNSNLKAKATDIVKYYNVKSKSKRVGDKLVRGYEIINRLRDESSK
jgi:hypothetical protein